MISNLIVYNADPWQASVISGVLAGSINDIMLQDISNLHHKRR